MRRQCCAIYSSFHHHVGAAGIRFWRWAVDGCITVFEVENGTAIDKASVCDQNVKTTPLLPDSLEEVDLRSVGAYVALNEDGCLFFWVNR